MPDLAQSVRAVPFPSQRKDPTAFRPFVVLVPLLIVFYAFFLLPPETEFSLFGVRFYGYRLGVLMGTVPALWMTIRDARGFLNRIDLGVALMSFWIILSFISHYGLAQGLIRGAGPSLDAGLSYFVARACIVTPNDLRRFLILIVPGLLFAGGVMALESLSGHLLMRPLATDLFGTMTKYYGGETVGIFQLKEEFRLGLLRAYGPFDHPILGGTIMTGFLPLYYYSGLRGWPLVLGMFAALCGLFSLSSAAFLGVFLIIAAIAINYALPYIPKLTWWMIITMGAMVLTTLHLISTNGIVQVISRLTLTPGTAFYRIYIWRYGIANVEKNPIFGIGYSQWERPAWMISDSIDAHFLALAVTYGLLVPVLLLAGIGFGMIRIGRIMNAFDVRNRNMLLGLNIAVFVYVIVGQTVAFFSTGVVVFMVMVGFMASMASWAEYQYKTDRQKALMRSRAMLYASQVAAGAR